MHWISLLGIVVILLLAWCLSTGRREVAWRPILWGIGLLFVFAAMMLRRDAWSFAGMAALSGLVVTYLIQHRSTLNRLLAAVVVATTLWLVVRGIHGQDLLAGLGRGIAEILTLSDYGARFLFGNLVESRYYFPEDTSVWPGFGYQFAFKLLPVIVFFGGLMGVLYYLGVMQRVIESIAHFMRWILGTSGSETLCAAANIFIGQTEAPLLIRPYLTGLTASELLTVMVAGFATIAGGGMAAYIAMGVPAGHILAASVMSAPAALIIAKILVPEREHSETAGDVKLPPVDVGGNLIAAATNGIGDGLRLAVNVGAMLVGFISLVALVDLFLSGMDAWIDGGLLGGALVERTTGGLSPVTAEYRGVFPGSLQTLFGTLLRPLAWLLGVPWSEAATVGGLMGIKLSLNEFVGYTVLVSYIKAGALSERSVILSTYALCGFANFASIGIQIGGLSALAPRRKGDLARVGLRAMLGGALASFLTAAVAGTLIQT